MSQGEPSTLVFHMKGTCSRASGFVFAFTAGLSRLASASGVDSMAIAMSLPAMRSDTATLQKTSALQAVLPQNRAKAAVAAQLLEDEGVFEAQLDKEFFQERASKGQKVKLTKAEKRALKFMARREEAQSGDGTLDEVDSAQDLHALKSMLAGGQRQQKGRKQRVEAGAMLQQAHRK